MRLIFRLLLTGLLLTAAFSNGVRVATLPCNGVIPIDSQTNLDPVWSLAFFRNRVMRLSNNAISLSHLAVDRNEERFLVSETGLQVDSVTVFAIAPVASSNSAELGSTAEATACTATLNPLLGAMDGMTSRAARFTILRAGDASGAVCSFPLNVSLVSGDEKSAISMLVESEPSGFSNSVGFSVSDKSTWPLRVSFSSQCALQFILVLDRYGAIERWYVWIPATVYTAIIAVAFLPVMVWRRQLPVQLVGVFLFLVFFGFLGSCIGLVVELLQWQSALSRMFPFPPSVTLYCCLCVLHILLFLPVLCREGSNTVLFMGAVRFFTYGLNCALCVGYWIAGYVVLGSLAVFQLVATSCILTWYYAYVSVYLRRAVRGTSSLPKFSNNFVYLWCVPVTPFACCGLMYYDLYALAQQDVKADASAQRARDVIRVYNTQISLPLVFFQNVYGVALLATATAFHMPFVVLLFVALLLGMLHIVYVGEQYGREWSRWRRSGGFLDRCGHLSLSPVMAKLLLNLEGESATAASAAAPSFVTHVVPEAASPSSQSVRRRGISSQYEADIAAYRESQALSSTASDDDTSDDHPRQRPRRHLRDHSAAYSTPSRQNISDAPEYWPSSVER